MKSTDSLKEEMKQIIKSLEKRQREIAAYAESIQNAITNASVQIMLERKCLVSDAIKGDDTDDSPIASHLLRLAEFGDDTWATPLMAKANEVNEIETTLECMVSFKHLLEIESWQRSHLQKLADSILKSATHYESKEDEE